MKNTQKNIMILISGIMALLILVQHHYVYMYFDDYGYASLSYAGYSNNSGMDFGIGDIVQFLKFHYLNWGGRVLYFFLEIAIFRIGGLPLMQKIQAVVIIFIGVASGKLIAMAVRACPCKCVSLALVLFGTMHIKTLRDGVYWYSASVLYIWPMLPFLGSICLWFKNQKKATRATGTVCILLTFFAAFSQEQFAVLTLSFYVVNILFEYLTKTIKNLRFQFGVCASAMAGGAITIFAPGNMVRAQSGIYDVFYDKGIWARTIHNVGYIINDNAGLYNCVFIFFLTIFGGLAVATYFRSTMIAVITALFALCFLAEGIVPLPKEIGVVTGGLWLIIFMPLLALYYFKRGNFLFLSLLIAGICTQVMMVVSPAIPLRLHIMFELVLQMIMAECIVFLYKNTQRNRKRHAGLLTGVGILLIYAGCNMAVIISGYRANYEINQKNNQILIAAREQYNENKLNKTIVLYRLKNDIYAQMMPYQEGYDYIEVWMKKYYELPDEVAFEWD